MNLGLFLEWYLWYKKIWYRRQKSSMVQRVPAERQVEAPELKRRLWAGLGKCGKDTILFGHGGLELVELGRG